jgi:hypothetical protein
MKTFEEKWTAWLDGKLTGDELTTFEDLLPDKAAAEADKREAQKLGALLKEHLSAHPLSNEEFFNHQLRETIERESAKQGRHVEAPTWWNIRRLAWVGSTAIAIFCVCTFFVMRQQAPAPSDYLTEILNTQVDPTANPYATTSIVQAKKDKVTVLWVEGLKSLPADYASK